MMARNAKNGWIGLAALAALAVALPGCSYTDEWFSAPNVYRPPIKDLPRNPPRPAGATVDEEKPSNLASVPERPEPGSTPAQRRAVESGLVGDRDNARYTDEQLRGRPPTPSTSAATAPRVPAPPAAAAPSPAPSSGVPAAAPIAPVLRTEVAPPAPAPTPLPTASARVVPSIVQAPGAPPATPLAVAPIPAAPMPAAPIMTAAFVPPTALPTTAPTVVPTVAPTVAPPTSAPQRIQFAPGAVSKTIASNVQAPNRNRYVLRAMAGQEMTVEIASPGQVVNFAVSGVDDGQPYKRLDNEDRFWSGSLPATQDYLITVVTANGNPAYLLTVTVITPAATPPPVSTPMRIRFAPGAISETIPGTLASGATAQYVLGAAAGQSMTVTVTSPGNDLLFSIPGLVDGVTSWTGMLPSDGDYFIALLATGSDTSYTLAVTIE